MTGDVMQQDPAVVEVQKTSNGQVISIQQPDGKIQRITINRDGSIAGTDAAPGQATTAPAAPSEPRRKALPDGLVDMMGIIFGAVTVMSLGTPLVKAWARRFEKRTEFKQQALVEQRLAAIEQAIDSVAVEVERISEGQRFTSKLLADRAPADMERIR
jgi:hypothetical protein